MLSRPEPRIGKSLAWMFHTREAGAPACCRLRPFDPYKPATCRRSDLFAIRRGCAVFRLGVATRRPTERGHSCPQLSRWLSRGPQCSMPLAFPLHPEGMFENSPTFQRWVRPFGGTQVPKGRLSPRPPSAVPSGLILLRALVPNVETLGYYRLSLRDKGQAKALNAIAGAIRPSDFGLPSAFGLRPSDFARLAQSISR